MDFQRILILAGLAVTAYMLVLAWNDDYNRPGQTELTSASVDQVASASDSAVPQLPNNDQSEFIPTLEPTADSSVQTGTDAYAQTLNNHKIVRVVTDVLVVEIDVVGGDIKKLSLPAFPVALDKLDEPYVLLDPRNNYSAQSGLIGDNGTDTAVGRPTYKVSSDFYELDQSSDTLTVDLVLEQSAGVTITKRFTFRRADYLIDVEYIIDNQAGTQWRGALFTQIKRNSEVPVLSDESAMGMQPYVGGATFQEEGPYTKLEFDDIEEESYKHKVNGGYIAMVQHYFVSAWVPGDQSAYTYQARKLSNQDSYLFGFTGPLTAVMPGQQSALTAKFYAGPKDQHTLESISTGLNLTIDYGFLWWLAQPLFDLLTFIHTFVGNWGVSIIILTIIVKSLLYPLSAASFKSMAKMRKLQPEMAKLKERHGDDKQKFSQAMMELYKKEGANPLGGCLPMLLQMPVFIALYWALMESVELRQAPFILWIDDLSAMDPYFVLPILMGISMFVTQMLQPEPPDPIQAKVFKLMPIMFTFFFLWFPSGLVLYWFINNLLSILQQWFVTRQIEKA
ncbi:MAG: membrane protein insertase YidC [Pseudomonadales bacterium]|jgi:YidC/Oxa1 family membrane protein insertase|nr:membrane protein insertase YidC [Pseudomonadales bacterium]